MARKNLELLTSRVDSMKEKPASIEPAPAVVLAPVEPAPAETTTASASTAPATAAPHKPEAKSRLAPVARAGAIVDEYERKETWLRPDQIVELDQLAKQLQRAKQPSEKTRITANTLIRVAVDVLLERYANDVQGDTEAQIRESVTSRVPAK